MTDSSEAESHGRQRVPTRTRVDGPDHIDVAGAAYPGVIGLLVFLLLAASPFGTATRFQSSSASSDPAEVRLYAPDQQGSSISVLDGDGRLVDTVNLAEYGFPARSGPHDVAVSPDGSAWYVTLSRAGFVAKFDRENRLVAQSRFDAPGMIVLDPAANRVYVSRSLTAVNPPSSLGVFHASDLKQVGVREVLVSRPHALAVDTASRRLYTASLDAGRIAALDLRTGELEVTEVSGLPSGFVGMDTSPDGRILVASAQGADQLLVFDAGDRELRRRIAVSVEPGPYDVAFSPDGRSVWFPNQAADAVTRVSAETWTVEAVVRGEGLVEPHGVRVGPRSGRVYVSSHGPYRADRTGTGEDQPSGALVVIDAASNRIRRTTPVVPNAAALGLGVMR